MRRRMIIIAGVLALAAVSAAAQAPTETPFPSPKVAGAFVRVQTVTTPQSGYLTNYFPRGGTVVFRVFAGENKTGRALTDKDVAKARILIPGQPAVKLAYSSLDPQWPWVGAWTIPSDFQLGIVGFTASIKTKAKVYGSFVQIPVATSQLTVTAT